DDVDPGRGGMNTVGLVQLGIGGNPVQEEGIQRHAVLGGDVGIYRVEFRCVVAAVIGRRHHAAEHDGDAARLQPLDDVGQRLTGDRGIDAAQGVVGTELDD